MIWIKANKARLYKLVAEYVSMPMMKLTNFIETPSGICYYLGWSMPNGVRYRACYTVMNGAPVLVIQVKNGCKASFKEVAVHKLDIDNLINIGLTKVIQRESLKKTILLNQQLFSID